MSKKVLCAILVAVMVMGLAIPAFAADQAAQTVNSTNGYAVKLDSSTAVAAVSVKIQDKAAVIFNPYKQKYSGTNTRVQSVFTAESADRLTQFLSPSLLISSDTKGKLSLKVSAKAALTTGMELTDKPVSWESKSPTEKKLFMYVAFFADSSDFTLRNSSDSKTTPYSADFRGTAAKSGRDNMVAFTSDGQIVNTPVFYFNEGSGETGVDAEQHGYFRILGDAATSPETPWSDKDKITPTLTFTFTPVADIPTTVPNYMISASSDAGSAYWRSAD